jgi:Superinfection immunity protein
MVHTLGLLFFPIFGLGFVFYFLPSIVAFARSKRDSASILILNLLLGWTAIGWVIALVWSLRADVPVIAR